MREPVSLLRIEYHYLLSVLWNMHVILVSLDLSVSPSSRIAHILQHLSLTGLYFRTMACLSRLITLLWHTSSSIPELSLEFE